MKIIILPKIAFDNYLLTQGINDENVEEQERSMYISIHGSIGEIESPYFNENHDNVLHLFFDDVEDDIFRNGEKIGQVFSDEQGIELITFIKKNKSKQNCLVHCAAGISRSGAVGTFINDYLQQDFFAFRKINKHILPNGKVIAVLNKLIRDNE